MVSATICPARLAPLTFARQVQDRAPGPGGQLPDPPRAGPQQGGVQRPQPFPGAAIPPQLAGLGRHQRRVPPAPELHAGPDVDRRAHRPRAPRPRRALPQHAVLLHGPHPDQVRDPKPAIMELSRRIKAPFRAHSR